MKTFVKKICILIIVLPLLGAINYKDNDPGGCAGLPDFDTIDNGKVVLTTKSVNKIETDTQITVYGEVENKGSKPARNIQLTANLKDKSGNIVETVGPVSIIGISRRLKSAPDTIDHSTLDVGEKGYFSISADKTSEQANVTTVETSLTGDEDIELEGLYAKMSATITTKEDVNKKLRINGFLKNNSTGIDTWNNKITVIAKNKAEQIVFIGEVNLGDTLTIDDTQRENAIIAGNRKSFIFATDVLYDTVGKNDITTNINWEEKGPSTPNAPGNLELSLESVSEVTMTFTDNSNDEKGFKIFRKAPGEKKFKRIKIWKAVSGNDNTVIYTDKKSLLSGKIYTYKVLAYNELGISEFSNTERIEISAPDSPGNLKATITSESSTSGTTTQITLSWDEKENSAALAVLPSGVNFTGSLKDKITYDSDKKVLIFDGAMTSDEKIELKGLSKDTNYQKAINILYTESNISNNEVGFSIFRDGVEIATISTDKTTYNDENVIQGQDYSYQITAFNVLGASSAVGPVEITFDKPNTPTELTVTSLSGTSNKLTWNGDDINNEQGFAVEKKAGSGEFIEIGTVDQEGTTFTDKFVNPSSTYTYRVKAYNALGDSDPSDEVSP